MQLGGPGAHSGWRRPRRSGPPSRILLRSRAARRGRWRAGSGLAGPCRPAASSVSPLNIPGWRDFPSRARLAELTGLPTWIDNDAKALALADGWVGEAAGLRELLSMVVSTGIGGGIVLDGRLLDGDDGNAGHIGHVVVEPDRPALRVRRSRVPGGGGVRDGHRGHHRRPPADAGAEVVVRTGTLVGRAVASAWPICSTCSWHPSAARWPWVSASRSSPRPGRARRPGPIAVLERHCRIVPSRLGAGGSADRGGGGRMAGPRRASTGRVNGRGATSPGPGTRAGPGGRRWPGRAPAAVAEPGSTGAARLVAAMAAEPLPAGRVRSFPDPDHVRRQRAPRPAGPHRLPRMVSPDGVAGAVTSGRALRTPGEEGADPAAAHRRPPGR